ncbi:MAG TPA: diacylglycerol kinase family protein [Chthoniobacterales bacterium]
MRVILIHNPKAGAGKPSARALETLFEKAGHQVLYTSTEDADWENRLREPADAVVIAGGDGSVGLAAPRIAERGLPFCVLPLGTANNIAKSLNEDRPIEEIVATLDMAEERSVDLGMVAGCRSSQPFIESVGVGLMVELVRRNFRMPGTRERNPAVERKSALRHLLEFSEEYGGVECELQLDEQKLSGRYLLVEVMNMGLIGPNLPLVPYANAGDGRLDVVCVEVRQRRRLKNYLERLSADKHATLAVGARQCRRAEIHCSKPVLHVDDAAFDSAVAVVEVKGAALRFLEPTDTRRDAWIPPP